MKIIFCDVDGVLNNDKWFENLLTETKVTDTMSLWPGGHLDPDNIINLDRLVCETGARIVLSSAWRSHISCEMLAHLLRDRGYTGPEFIGRTPRLTPLDGGYTYRGHEIQAWLDEHGADVTSIVILDDMEDMVHLSDRYVKTDPLVGLTDADVDRAIKILKTPWESDDSSVKGFLVHESGSLCL